MNFKSSTTIARGLLALAISLGAGVAAADDSEGRSGPFHATKDCTPFNGLSGGHCTIASSNLAQIPAGSNVYYDQAAVVPTGLLDSNVVLDAGHGNRAVGRCTLDLSTGIGLCTFSDGLGTLAGFSARINVSFLQGKLWAWDGTYSFKSLPDK
jgi:hypothetical protein